MPKPLAGVQGSGMHTHMSLFEGDTQRLRRRRATGTGSPRWPSGSSPACCATPARSPPSPTSGSTPTSGSSSGYEAPVHVVWARNNRSALVRVPVVKTGKTESTRLEYRAPDSACNPYLAFAVILAAGLRGIEEGYELPPEADANLFALTPEELAEKGIEPLPGSLHDAVDEMEGSELLAETLGDHVFEWFIRNKRAEWAAYKAQVTQFELDRYLPLL